MPADRPTAGTDEAAPLHDVAKTLAWLGALALALLFLWKAGSVLLLILAAVLLALILRAAAELLRSVLPLSETWALAVVLILLLVVMGLAGWLLAPDFTSQMAELIDRLPRAANRLLDQLESFALGRQIMEQIPDAGQVPDNVGGILRRALGVFSTTLGALGAIGLILLFGLYLAFNPQPYIAGIVQLIPRSRRARGREVLHVLSATLTRWMVGRMVDMLFVGTLLGVSLWLMGIPLALSLAILAGVLNFIPNLGPILAAVPAVMLGLMESPVRALQVAAIYMGVQFLEGFVLTPFIEKKSVYLPPVMVMCAQLLAAVFFGLLGLAVATPLTAAAVVVVKMLYVEDVLGDEAKNLADG